MYRSAKLLLTGILLGVLSFNSCGNINQNNGPETIKVASFNIKDFGQSKCTKEKYQDTSTLTI